MITSLPIKKFPRVFAVGREVREDDLVTNAAFGGHTGPTRPGESVPTRGQILWIRSINRLQQQVFYSVSVTWFTVGAM